MDRNGPCISRHGYTHLYSQPSSSHAVVEALQLYNTLQYTALQRSTVYSLYTPPLHIGP